jgi:hypothetical protein
MEKLHAQDIEYISNMLKFNLDKTDEIYEPNFLHMIYMFYREIVLH